jgi:DNA topoisomerase-1
MKFSALTQGDLLDAYENRGEFDYNNAYAGEARHILDWYYGINLSRALMGALKAASRYRVLSIGRVQGPTLSILAGLEKEIRAFVPTPYWELSLFIDNVEFGHTQGRFEEEEKADIALDATKDRGIVSNVEKKDQKIPSPACFDLTGLQVECFKLFKYSPSRTLEIAQTLYEASVITYPRTSSQQLPPSINVTKIIKDIAKIHEYEKLAKKLIDNKWFKPTQGKKEDPAHPAIHPTGIGAKFEDGPEKNVYDLIVRRFLSAFAPEAIRQRVRVEADFGGQVYSASGGTVTDKGWTEFYGQYFTTEDVELPPFKPNQKVEAKDKKKEKKETKPPKRYTQASLVSELEDRHLGTKSTRSVVIDTLMKRGYAEGTSINVSDFGIKITDVLAKYAPEILDENLTRKIEEEMEGIQNGKINKDDVIKEGQEILTQILDKWKANEERIGRELLDALKVTQQKENILGDCDKCTNKLRIIRMKDGRQFIGCYGYPNCRNAYPLPGGAIVKPTMKKCNDCSKPTINVKKGKTRYTMCIDPNCPSKLKWKTAKMSESNEKDNGA